jgi:DNA mismatch endonuclease, patch repair protein
MKETPELRSRIMRAVKRGNTGPELIVRSLAHRMGYRFRLHRKDLPGKPDLVFPSLRKAIFVHGCFWHGHDCARGARAPKTNREYWQSKIERNRSRDVRTIAALTEDGWNMLVIWECEMQDDHALQKRIKAFLSPNGASRSAA